MCASAVAGTVDLTTERETAWCFAWYGLFLAAFAALSSLFAPGPWAMHLHDWFGNAGLIFFIIFWSRKDKRRAFFVCLLVGGQVLSAYTHTFDLLALKLLGYVPEGFLRPHNILHTPAAAVLVSLAAAPLARFLMKGVRIREAFFFFLLGYSLHVVMDSITYDYPVFILWPFHQYSASLISVFQQPDAVSSWLGSPLYVFSMPDEKNTDGFIVYRSEVAINLLLAALFGVKALTGRLLRRAL